MRQAAKPLTLIDTADADLDLRALVSVALEMGALGVHVQSGQQRQARAQGQMVVIDGFKIPTVPSVRTAVAKVVPGPTDTGKGDLTDFTFSVGEQVCRTIPWDGQHGTVGVSVRLIPQGGNTTRRPSDGTGSGKTAVLYAELKRAERPDCAEA